MPREIYLVKVGMNMTEGIVEEWCIADGERVEKGALLYRLETEKVNLDVDAEATGIVKHGVGEGVTMKPGDVVGYIYESGETVPDRLPEAGAASLDEAAPKPSPGAFATVPVETAAPTTQSLVADGRLLASPAARRLAKELQVEITTLNGSGPGGRIVEADVQAAAAVMPEPARALASSPMARKLARESDIDLGRVEGTGPSGRITKEDVERAAAATSQAATPSAASHQPTQPATTPGLDRQIPVRAMRRTIAKRMFESLQTSAQLTMNMDVNMDDAIKLRSQLIEEWQNQGLRPTYTDLVIRASAKALAQHPMVNSVYGESEIRLVGDIHVGMAVALDEGLIVPVIRHADQLSMQQLAEASSRLAIAARAATLTPDDLQGGTFTVSALGMFGVDSFTPIINAPQSAILGVNRIRDGVRWAGATPQKTREMRLSLTWDHRVLDGAPAAQFLGTVRDLLEAPYRLLV